MNCETYRSLLMENPVGASGAQAGSGHAETCPACAEFRREQQRLLSLLTRIREEDAAHSPVASNEATGHGMRIERNLLAAFRALQVAHSSESLPPVSFVRSASPEASSADHESLPMISPVARELRGTRFPKWGALAAAVIVSLGVRFWVSQQPMLRKLPSPPRVSHLPQLPRDWSVLSAGTSRATSRMTGEGQKSATAGTASSAKTLSVDEMESTETFASPEEPLASSLAASNGDEFIPLVPRTPGFLDDGPVVMRVRLPYAAAEYLGAPGGVAAHGQPPGSGFVQADLLVGSDGTTRAIRFVQ